MIKKYGASILIGCFICLVILVFMLKSAITNHRESLVAIYKIEGLNMQRCDQFAEQESTQNEQIDLTLYEHNYDRCMRKTASLRNPQGYIETQ